MNLLENVTPAKLTEHSLNWEPQPTSWEPLPEGGVRVRVPAKVDYFRDPAGKYAKDDAPYLWTNVSGDFVAQANVKPTFASTYDSGVLMARHDERNWAKLCFERTDFGTTAAVSVVTRDTSDDANGVNLTVENLWLQMFRAGNVFGLHYSLDGKDWRMVRIFELKVPDTIKVGLVAQCPAGPGTTVDFLSLSIEQRTVQDMRAGQ